jgi:hypothetical protein
VIDTAFELAAREAAILLALGLLGAGPAAAVPGPLPAVARAAVAPAFGLALGAGLMLSASQLMPMSTAAWAVLAPLAVLSVAVAIVLSGSAMRRSRRIPLAHLLGALAAVVLPLVALDAPLVDQRTVGPVGYSIADAPAYAKASLLLEQGSWGSEKPYRNLDAGAASESRYYHDVITAPVFQAGSGPLHAALNAAFGWRAIDSQTALLAALVAIGSLGCFAFLLAATGRAWAAAAAALLFAGPVVYQLFIDSSQTALAALSLIGAAGLVASRLTVDPLRGGLLAGLIVAGVATLYPSYLPIPLGAGALALAVGLVRRRIDRAELRTLALAGGCAAAVLVLVAPFALAKDARYAREVSGGVFEHADVAAATEDPVRALAFGKPAPSRRYRDSLPHWDLPTATAPAWVAGSRDIYYLPTRDQTSLQRWALSDLLFPLLVLVLAALGALRYPPVRVLLPAAAAALAIAGYSLWVHDCEYCSERNLLPLGPIAAVLAAAGLAAIADRLRHARPRFAAVGLAVLAIALIAVPWQRDWALAQRLTEGGSFVSADLRALLERAAAEPGPVAIEGSGAGPPEVAGIESPLLLIAAAERLRRPVVVDWRGLPTFLYYPDDPPRESDLDPGYELVLTRLAGIRTPRKTILRRGPYALQRRSGPSDVLVSTGVVSDLARRDPRARAWVTAPPQLSVSTASAAPVYVRMALRGPAVATVHVGARATVEARSESSMRVCLRVSGGRWRRATVPLRFRPPPAQPSPDRYGRIPVPGKELRLVSLEAGAARCR